jgi:hypothetical protein
MDCTTLWLSFIEPFSILWHVLVLGVACGAISFVVTRAAIFNFFHDWLEKKSPFLEEMLSCPLCTSHWVALGLTLIYRPLLLNWGDRPAWMYTSWVNYVITPVDYLVTIMVMVTIASVTARVIHSAYKPIMG